MGYQPRASGFVGYNPRPTPPTQSAKSGRWHCSYCTLINYPDENRCTGCGAPNIWPSTPLGTIDPIKDVGLTAAQMANGFVSLGQTLTDGGLVVPVLPKSTVRLVSIEGEPKMKWRIAFQRLALLIVAILVACAWLFILEMKHG